MNKLRREFLKLGMLFPVAGNIIASSAAVTTPSGKRTYRRIATEEAFITEDIIKHWRNLLGYQLTDEPGFNRLAGFWLQDRHETGKFIEKKLLDLGKGRVSDMDKFGIDVMLLSLTAPGVQMFDDAPTAISLAADANDQLADAVKTYPKRYAGLTAIAPQDPKAAAEEIDRGINKLGFKGVIINSHTNGEFLDHYKFWPILEAAEANSAPIYLHPRNPPPDMIKPFLGYGLEGAMWGFAVESGTHALRLILSGAFDRFPKLKIVLGHLGEGIPYYLYRIDRANAIHGQFDFNGRFKNLKKKPSEYFQENFWVTTSGMCWEPAVMFNINVLGEDKVIYAADYPYNRVPDGIQVLDKLPVSNATKKKIYEANAVKLFNL